MPTQILAFALIILAFLPGFSYKGKFEDELTKKVLGSPKGKSTRTVKRDPIIPLKVDPMSDAQASAAAAYFVDFNSGEVLYAKNETKRLPMASTTKLMTAIIAIENLELDEPVTVGHFSVLPLDTTMGLSPGDKIRVSELLHGLLIESGADAAQTLAVAVSGTENKFVTLMNEKAGMYGLSDTQFADSIGHDNPNAYASAKDLSKLATIALTNKTIKEIVAKKTYTARAQSGKTYYLSNTNLLLSDSRFRGIKTGTTYAAGQSLISLYDDGERKILGVVLNSPSRFYETASIIEWTKRVFTW